MIRHLSLGIVGLAFLALGACHPYQEKPKQMPQQGAQQANKPKETKKPTEAEAQKKVEGELKPKTDNTAATTNAAGGQTTDQPTGSDAGTTPAEPKRTDYAFATKVPGKEGYVFSPYNNKVVDVKDLPSGTLVADPTYPPAEKKYFRVP